MKTRFRSNLAAVVFMIILQSCTSSSPYEDLQNGNQNQNQVENEHENDDDDDDSGSGTGTGTGTGSGTGTGTGTGTITLSGSATGSNSSHNMGQNCMNCHFGGGSGQGVWKVAGTVYKPNLTTINPNTVVKLYTGPNGTGTLKYILNVNAKGNFYTSQTVSFTGGLYPAVTNGTDTNYMSSSITVGACNSCHNNSTTDRIWIN